MKNYSLHKVNNLDTLIYEGILNIARHVNKYEAVLEKNTYLNIFLEDIKKLWGNLNLLQRFGMILLLILTLVSATFFLVKSTEPNWSVLYSDLTQQDTLMITESLRKNGYQFKVNQEKDTILVPLELQEELRIFIAENDLIKDSSPGFELLDDLQFGSTDFKNKLTRQRIFQGELTRTIERLNGIKKARVQIAEPERSIFTDKDETPSASVMLVLDPGYQIKTSQVKAIKNLVAYSIPRLTPDKVFLTDQSGNALSDEIQKNSSDIESYRINFERNTAKKIQDVLDKITGIGNSSVQVSAEIDFNTVRSTIESYIPTAGENGVLASSQSETEIYQNPNNGVTEENTVNNKKLNYEKQKNAVNYNVSKEVKQVIYAPGSVKRLTVAVAINKILTTNEKNELKNLILSACGANPERGDIINISSMEFASNTEQVQAQEKMIKEIEKNSKIEFWANKVVSPFIFLIFGVTALFVLRSLLKSVIPEVEEEEDKVTTLLQEDFNDLTDMEPLLQLETKMDPEIEKMKTDLSDTIMSDPAEATRLLMNYIKE